MWVFSFGVRFVRRILWRGLVFGVKSFVRGLVYVLEVVEFISVVFWRVGICNEGVLLVGRGLEREGRRDVVI